ncbi:MAG TPA: hypothetical protein VJ783_29685 [Pirellulales bacterium]|nr:hypothetical protein [Pirellulales bacterium]
MVDFTFYALQPKWIERDRFYKVYVTREAVLGAWLAGQLWSWSASLKQLLMFAPLAYWPLRWRDKREATYDRLIGNPKEFLARDRRNFSLPRELIRDAQPTNRVRSWTGLYGGSTLTLDLAGHGLLDLIVIKFRGRRTAGRELGAAAFVHPDSSHDVAERLDQLGYPEIGAAQWVPALPDDGNPYRAPRCA